MCKKSLANAKGNVQQRCMFESPVKKGHPCYQPCFFCSRQRAPDDRRLIIYSVLLVLARGRDLPRAVSAGNRKFSLPPSYLAPSFGVTPFEFMEKLYGS